MSSGAPYGLNNLSSAASPLFVWAVVECIVDGVSIGSQYYPLSSITSYSLTPGSDNGTYAGYYVVSYASGTLARACCEHFSVQTIWTRIQPYQIR